jgi:hypothetical protein
MNSDTPTPSGTPDPGPIGDPTSPDKQPPSPDIDPGKPQPPDYDPPAPNSPDPRDHPIEEPEPAGPPASPGNQPTAGGAFEEHGSLRSGPSRGTLPHVQRPPLTL